jgi:hypothetical protein
MPSESLSYKVIKICASFEIHIHGVCFENAIEFIHSNFALFIILIAENGFYYRTIPNLLQNNTHFTDYAMNSLVRGEKILQSS